MMPRIASRALTVLAMPILVPALLLVPRCLPALEDDPEGPLYLEADSAELFEAISLSIYRGDVFARQGNMELRGDQVMVHHDPERRPEFIIVIGTPATYLQREEGEEKDIEAAALHMEYDTAKDEITLIGQAVVFQGEDTFRSDHIIYDRARARIKAGTVAEGKERVKIRISPSPQ
ncbi:lipopolysaccharide transport periplasmic protein LptA [Candidatus Thiosymbion oneisti]|uniref:lipopolysaccharide transport periplasmic protein LptA n=1 Tax=Candidatus Thiosymbion oneisti TaxID=589554 RepID=UPI00105F6773|nr:lipopolysaccharide transport periplasmic protein LptA [Candidatus Thiosymbion oneisti]